MPSDSPSNQDGSDKPNPEVYVADGDYIKDIEINDLRNRYTLTKGSTQKMVITPMLFADSPEMLGHTWFSFMCDSILKFHFLMFSRILSGRMKLTRDQLNSQHLPCPLLHLLTSAA